MINLKQNNLKKKKKNNYSAASNTIQVIGFKMFVKGGIVINTAERV